MGKKISGQKLLIAFFTALWIAIIVAVLGIFKITVIWPAMTALNIIAIIGMSKGNIIKTFASCISGIAIALIYVYGASMLVPQLGQEMAFLLGLVVILFFILAFDEVFPTFINSFALIVFVYCTVNMTVFSQSVIPTVISALVGGGFALVGVIGIHALVAKHSNKKTATEE